MECVSSESLDAFLDTTIPPALRSKGVRFSPYAEAYLLGVLGRHLRRNVEDGKSFTISGLTDADLKTIRVTYEQSQQSPGRILTLAEHCLITAGFFPESIAERHCPNRISAYVKVGTSAYARADDLFSQRDAPVAVPFREIAQSFVPTARALQDVYHSSRVLFD